MPIKNKNQEIDKLALAYSVSLKEIVKEYENGKEVECIQNRSDRSMIEKLRSSLIELFWRKLILSKRSLERRMETPENEINDGKLVIDQIHNFERVYDLIFGFNASIDAINAVENALLKAAVIAELHLSKNEFVENSEEGNSDSRTVFVADIFNFNDDGNGVLSFTYALKEITKIKLDIGEESENSRYVESWISTINVSVAYRNVKKRYFKGNSAKAGDTTISINRFFSKTDQPRQFYDFIGKDVISYSKWLEDKDEFFKCILLNLYKREKYTSSDCASCDRITETKEQTCCPFDGNDIEEISLSQAEIKKFENTELFIKEYYDKETVGENETVEIKRRFVCCIPDWVFKYILTTKSAFLSNAYVRVASTLYRQETEDGLHVYIEKKEGEEDNQENENIEVKTEQQATVIDDSVPHVDLKDLETPVTDETIRPLVERNEDNSEKSDYSL